MTKEKIAGFLFGVGVGTALGFFLRDDIEENGHHLTGGAEQHRGRVSDKTFSKAEGRPSQTHAAGVSNGTVSAGIQEDRTVLAI